MTTGTAEEKFEYRIQKVIRGILKNNGFKPASADELFNFLEDEGAREFSNAVVADMVTWTGEDDWFRNICTAEKGA